MATVASRNRSAASATVLAGYSCEVCSNAGRRSLACKLARSRNTTCCCIRAPSALNRSGGMRRVELLFLAHLLLRNRIVRAPVSGGGADTAARRDLDAHIEPRHFRAGDRAHQHQLIEVPEMADAKYLAC